MEADRADGPLEWDGLERKHDFCGHAKAQSRDVVVVVVERRSSTLRTVHSSLHIMILILPEEDAGMWRTDQPDIVFNIHRCRDADREIRNRYTVEANA